MRYIVSLALAALSTVVCGYFANDPAKGITTGFSGGELKIIPWVVFFLTFVAMGKKKTEVSEHQEESDNQEQGD